MKGVCDEESYGTIDLGTKVALDKALERRHEMWQDILGYRLRLHGLEKPLEEACRRIRPTRSLKTQQVRNEKMREFWRGPQRMGKCTNVRILSSRRLLNW